MRGAAFCPGHITGFFRICDRKCDPLAAGSLGAGVNLVLGATTRVEAREARAQTVRVFINNRRCRARTTERAIRYIIGEGELAVDVRTTLQLPVSQGLGMSAAGALSASLALYSALGLPHTLVAASEAAHRAEIEEGTGLGDVAAQTRGGWEIRLRPGLPPRGFVDRLLAKEREVVLCVTGPPLRTKEVLRDPTRRRAVNRAGSRCFTEFLKKPSLESFFELSLNFVHRTGLVSRASLELARAVSAKGVGLASVSMIGNSVFAVGDTDALVEMMRGRGDVFISGVDLAGARLVE
ncbi:MAG: GHMP kinase [Thermoplasmata archaeon]